MDPLQPEIQYLNLEGGGKLIQPALEEMLVHALVSLEAKAGQLLVQGCLFALWGNGTSSWPQLNCRSPGCLKLVHLFSLYPATVSNLCCCSSGESSHFSRTPSESQAQSSGTDN